MNQNTIAVAIVLLLQFYHLLKLEATPYFQYDGFYHVLSLEKMQKISYKERNISMRIKLEDFIYKIMLIDLNMQ